MELINRQDVIDIIMGDGLYCDTYADKVYSAERIKNIPTVEPNKGSWIDGNEGKWNAVYCPKCSVCGTTFYGIETVRYHYCPNCGARMEE